MVTALIWSAGALDDIQGIAQFIGTDSPHHARRVVEGLLELGACIAERPQLGRMVPELKDPRVRERFLYSYRIIYELGAEQTEILAVLHGRRLLESVSERFEE